MTDKESVEFQFVIDTLNRFGYDLKNILISDIQAKDLVSKKNDGPHLKDSISFEVKKAGHNGGELLFYFPDHGRFIDIQYYKKTTNTKAAFNHSNRSILYLKTNRKLTNHKKDTRWYTKNVMGNLPHLIGSLMYGLTDAVEKQIISELLTNHK